jgi:subtilisin family serine protease
MLLLAGVCFSLSVIHGGAADTPRSTGRLLVKVRAPLAKSIEAALPLQAMELVSGQTGDAQIDQFLSNHSAHKAHPLYPAIVRLKKQRGLTDFQIATATRQKFSPRASRLRATFQPPEVSRTYVFELDTAAVPHIKDVLTALRADTNVEFAEEDIVVTTNLIPNDPYFSSSGTWGQAYDDLWGIKKIGSPAAWDKTAGAGVIVAVVDTGIDYNHPDIAANIWINTGEIPNNGIDDDGNGYIDDVRGWDFIGSTYTNPQQGNNPIDHFGHGTHVAGTIAAVGNNGIGVIGVAWQAQVMAVKGLDDNGNGLESTLGPAIMYAANNGADVISNSWAGTGTSQTIADAVNYAHNLGAVIVAAAGNNTDDARNYFPGNLWDAITVAATDHYDNPAYFSNYGSKIDVGAPGVDILSLRAAGTSMGTPVDANYTRADGTSMATPHVSGLAALILAEHPDYSNEDVRQAIRVSAYEPSGIPGFNPNYGYGRINAAGAVGVTSAIEAKISAPADGTTISALTTISGFARGASFASYVLQYGAGTAPTSWTTIQTGSSPVPGTALGIFDPTVVPDGIYTVRLVVYDGSNNPFVDQIQLTVKYVSITNPLAPIVPITATEFKPGMQVSIAGTAAGPSFSDFRLEWVEGVNPSTGWSSTGMTLTNGGAAAVTNGVVGTWDTTSITVADYYTIRLSVDNAGFTSHASTLIYLEPSLLSSSWPIALDQAPNFGAGLVPAVDASNNVRLTMENPRYANTSVPAQFWSFSPDGSSQNITSIFYGDYFQPAAGNVDGAPGDEAVVSEANDLLVFRSDNTSYALTPPIASNLEYANIVLEDLNNDSQLETIALGHDPFNPYAYVYAWRSNGTQATANFPIKVPDQNSNLWYPQGARVLVGDVNGDGFKELVVEEGSSSTTFTLGLFAHDGTALTWSAPTFNGTTDHMALADLDHNGKLETILIVDANSQKSVHVLQPDGTERTGWPVTLPDYSLTSIAVGDLNRDGHDQIVVSDSQSVLVLKPDGTSYSNAWPLVGSGFTDYGPAILADIDGDGRPEILLTKSSFGTAPIPLLTSTAAFSAPPSSATPTPSNIEGSAPQVTSEKQLGPDGTVVSESLHVQATTQFYTGVNYYEPLQLLALRLDGSVARSWNLQGAAGNQPFYWATLAVGDFNHDGLTDIAAVYYTISGGGISGYLNYGAATVLTTGTPFNPAANDWPMISQNPRNTAVYHPLLSVSITSPTAGTNVYGTVSVIANAPDTVAVPAVQFQLDGANLGPLITSAPYSVTWDTTQSSPGSHTLTAVASDASGNSAVSPPIIVTVSQFGTLSVSPTSLPFGGQVLNTTSASQSVSVTNTSGVPTTISGVTISGDFAQTSNCVTTLTAGGSCTINVTYTPTVRGSETGNLTITGNFTGGSSVVTLTGSGQALQANLSPSTLTFAAQLDGSSSAAQTLTYSNTGDVPVSISNISATGDFAETSTCGTSLAVGANCSISVTFTPTARGSRSGVLSITGNVNSSASLTGTGQAILATLAPSSLAFQPQLVGSSSAAQSLTYSNTGDLPVSISGISAAGDFAETSTCGTSLAVGANCSISVTFTPTARGLRSGVLSITGNVNSSASLTGTGQVNTVSISPSSINFGNQNVNTTSAPQNVTIMNTGDVSFYINGWGYGSPFTATNNCPFNLNPGASCTFSITFAPTSYGTYTGSSFTFSGSFPGSPATVPLSGIGVDTAAILTSTSLSFGNQAVGTTSGALSTSLVNTANTPVTISSIVASGDFSQTNNCGTSLAVSSSCTINVTFHPTTLGARSSSLTVNSNTRIPIPPATLSGTGTGAIASFNASTLTYAAQRLNSSSTAQTATLTNTGNATLTISNFSITGDFSQTHTCGSTLAAGASCSVSVTFNPIAQGTRTGTLTLSSNAYGTAPSVALTGTGVASVAALAPSSLAFANQIVNTTSGAQSVTLTNSGGATLNISSISVNGNYSQTNNCGTSLASGSSCTLNITFTPTSTGAHTGMLTIADDSLNGSPQTASLNGTGVDFSISRSPSSLTVNAGNSAVYTVSVTASGGNLGSSVALTCASGLPAGASCSFSPASVSPGSTSANSTLTIFTTRRVGSSGTPAGTYTIVLDGVSGSRAHTVNVTLRVK